MVLIRKGQVEDIEGLLDCEKRVWESLREFLPHSWIDDVISLLSQSDVSDRLHSRLAYPSCITLVAEDQFIVGLVYGSINRWKVSQVGFLDVNIPYRRQGIGRRLMNEYIEESKRNGAHKICLNTAPMLTPAIRLYIDLGFVPEGFLKQHAHGVDLIIYSKFLDS